MADKKSGKKKQFLLFGLVSVIALAACAVVLVMTVRSVDAGNSATVEYETQSKTDLKDKPETLLSYLKTLSEKAVGDRFIKADIYTDVSVDDGTVTVSDGTNNLEADRNLLIYAKNKILPTVDGYYPEDKKGVFGTVNAALPVIDLSADSIDSVTFSVGEAGADGNPVYNSDTGELIDADYYFITVCLKPEAEYSAQISEKFSSDIADVCTVNSSDISLQKNIIRAKINRLTDEIDTLSFDKTYLIGADVTFKDKLAVFSDRQIEFEYKTSERYEYSYAGIRFAQSSATVEPDGEIMLSVNAVIENDSEYTVTFSSSDPSVATVDEMGYVKGINASDKPVTITVTLSYLGETFTDECTVYVGNTAEK